MRVRDRIVELVRVPANSLRPNRLNWRSHPTQQADALRGILAEVGIAGAVLARRLADGSLELVDGHLRAETLGAEPVPVLVLDVTEQEAAKLLATYDPIGDLAGADAGLLSQLLAEADLQAPALLQLADELAAAHAPAEPEPAAPEPAPAQAVPEQFQVLVICGGEAQQAALLEELAGRGFKVRALIS